MRSTFRFGVDYYPEQWDETRWPQDAALMREAGFNVVRLAEFAWSALEPADGQFEFGWLDRAIDVLSDYGLDIVLGTPSAAPPPWLLEIYPDMAIVDADGNVRSFGSRRDASPAHPEYRACAVRVAGEMARRYGGDSRIIGWQIDNEFGDRCYSPGARTTFHDWLQVKYGTLDALNAAWGTSFWSHVYTAWAQIPAPRTTTHAHPNPGLHLDYYRFLSDLYVDFQQAQIDAVRRHASAHQFITHNLMGFAYGHIDYFDIARPLDLVSWDNYPSAFWRDPAPSPPEVIALNHAAMWGLKQQNFWVMEQQSGPSGWHILSPSPQPGQIALWAYQAVAHGADGILFFRWRTNPRGAEQNWHGILDYDGVPRRRFHEVCRMGSELGRVGSIIAGSEIRPQAAILQHYDSRFSFQIQPDHRDFQYETHTQDYFTALHRRSIVTAVVSVDHDLSAYKLVIAPALRLVDDHMAAALTAYVEQGGVLILTPRSGSRDHTNALVQTPLPGLLAVLCGVMVEEYDSLARGVSYALQSQVRSTTCSARIWCDAISLGTASTLFTYADGPYSGKPAVTLNKVGRGSVIYAGTFGDPALVDALVDYAVNLAQIEQLKSPSNPDESQIELAERWRGDQRLLFVLNHGQTSASLVLEGGYHDLLANESLADFIPLMPFQVRILTANNSYPDVQSQPNKGA